jgi:hypothetical protein
VDHAAPARTARRHFAPGSRPLQRHRLAAEPPARPGCESRRTQPRGSARAILLDVGGAGAAQAAPVSKSVCQGPCCSNSPWRPRASLGLLTPERLELAADNPARPILLAVSDNGPQMTSEATREFLALMAVAQTTAVPTRPQIVRQACRQGLERTLRSASPTIAGPPPTPGRSRDLVHYTAISTVESDQIRHTSISRAQRE